MGIDASCIAQKCACACCSDSNQTNDDSNIDTDGNEHQSLMSEAASDVKIARSEKKKVVSGANGKNKSKNKSKNKAAPDMPTNENKEADFVYDDSKDENDIENEEEKQMEKHIDEWTHNELQEWINTLNLAEKDMKHMVESIAEQKCSGSDFNSMEEISDIMDSFEINADVAQEIFGALKIIRSNNNNNNNYTRKNNVATFKMDPKNAGIIGLNNLKNTCFINSVIQALLQTPGVIEYLRTFIDAASVTGDTESMTDTMLDAFMQLAAAGVVENINDAVSPHAIVKHLRESDVKFAYGEQGDALSAVSKMIELLDHDIIMKNKKDNVDENKEEEQQHVGSWHINDNISGDNMIEDEEEIIEGNMLLYNPYKSVIRDHMHFVERNMFTCMKCNWKEARYEIKEKILLPLRDHSIVVHFNVYIPSLKYFRKQQCSILDYCPVKTLKYQIFHEIVTDERVNEIVKLLNVDQLTIHTMKINYGKKINDWVQTYDEKELCSELISKGKTIFAVMNSNIVNSNITVTTLHIRLNKSGDVNSKLTYLTFDKMRENQKISFADEYSQYNEKFKPDYSTHDMQILFDGKIYDANYQFQIKDQKSHTIVVIWMHSTMSFYKKYTANEARQLSFNVFMSLQNQKYVMKNNDDDDDYAIIRDINEGFSTYCCTKVLDRGAFVKCGGKCNNTKCDVFKKETKIVKFSNILIFAIDRHINDKKFKGLVGYDEIIKFEGNHKYQLYAVVNHAGNLGYGHYWAFVKSLHNNKWYQADDEKIKKINKIKNVIHQNTAILLFYKKIK